MIRENLKLRWSAQVRCDAAADPELLDLMSKAGCYYVYIGLESVSPTVLKCFDKRQSVEQMVHAIGAFHDRGIRIHGMFIFGADHDTRSTFHETVRFAKTHHIESAQFMILVPLPGTPVFEEMDRSGRLLVRDWSLYDAHHVVFQPKNMSTFELQRETLRVFCRFYSLGPVLRRCCGSTGSRWSSSCGATTRHGCVAPASRITWPSRASGPTRPARRWSIGPNGPPKTSRWPWPGSTWTACAAAVNSRNLPSACPPHRPHPSRNFSRVGRLTGRGVAFCSGPGGIGRGEIKPLWALTCENRPAIVLREIGKRRRRWMREGQLRGRDRTADFAYLPHIA